MRSCNLYKYFDEIPAYNFLKFLETPDLKYLFSISKETYEPEEIKSALENWNSIFQEYLDFVGLGDRTLRIMKQEDKIVRLKIQLLTKGKKHLSAVIKNEENILKELKKGNDSKDLMYNETAIISKYMGFHIKLKEINAKEYFAFAKNMKNE